jgi:hypothetical protein
MSTDEHDRRRSGAPKRKVTTMMPVSVPKVLVRPPGQKQMEWVDLWEAYVSRAGGRGRQRGHIPLWMQVVHAGIGVPEAGSMQLGDPVVEAPSRRGTALGGCPLGADRPASRSRHGLGCPRAALPAPPSQFELSGEWAGFTRLPPTHMHWVWTTAQRAERCWPRAAKLSRLGACRMRPTLRRGGHRLIERSSALAPAPPGSASPLTTTLPREVRL